MATVRIYRVAELLGTTSQEVMALLKRDHGIEVKSASSTIEEVVGRQFVDRLARQRGVTLPSGDIFAEGASAKAPGKKPVQGKKATTEPAKPAGPTLGPPRLVKAAKAIHEAERAAAAAAVESPDELAVVETPGPEFEETPAFEDSPAPAFDVSEVEPPIAAAAPSVAEQVEADAESTSAAPSETTVAASTEPAVTAPAVPPAGRLVPPTIRLRIEEAGAPRPAPSPARPSVPPQPRPQQPAAAARPAIVGPASRSGTQSGARPGVTPPRPAGPPAPRPSYPAPPLGGPRPLPSQPVVRSSLATAHGPACRRVLGCRHQAAGRAGSLVDTVPPIGRRAVRGPASADPRSVRPIGRKPPWPRRRRHLSPSRSRSLKA